MWGRAMSIRRDGIKTGALRWWVAHLLLLAIVSRALIPIGYMPDFQSADGVFKVVICSGMGAKSVSLDADGNPLPNQQSSHDEQPCAFAGIAAVALPALDAIPLSAPMFQTSILTPRVAVHLPPSRAGPTLGSRGPPQIS